MTQRFDWRDDASGLDAILILDDETLGPAAGGVRTRAYPSRDAAIEDAAALARAMTVKCALAGLAAGGGKCVVIDHAGLDRPRAFAELGRRITALGGRFRTAGDLGTTAADLLAMDCEWVHTDERGLADAVARGMLRCIEVLGGAHVAVQGAGAIGAAVARALVGAGRRVTIADLDPARAHATGAEVIAPAEILTIACDVLAPCAIGGVIDVATARAIRAPAVCGAANNVLAGDAAEDVLVARRVKVVPDVVASAGAVIEGIGRTVMGLADRTPLIDRLGATAARILDEAAASGERPSAVARRLARGVIEGTIRLE